MAALSRERLDDGIEVIRLDRPEVRNAMDTAMLAELDGALAELAADDALRALVFSTTSERALCAGADVGEQLDHAAGVARMEAFARLYAAVGWNTANFAVATAAVACRKAMPSARGIQGGICVTVLPRRESVNPVENEIMRSTAAG